MKLLELLTDKTKWTQHRKARDSRGFPVEAESEDAVSWCLLGANERCHLSADFDRLREVIHNKYKMSVVHWNDAPERTFDEVRDLLHKLDI